MATTTDWRPRPKVIAAGIVGLAVWALQAVGVDVSSVLDDVVGVLGIEVPDEDVVTAVLAGLVAGYIKKD